MSKELMTYRVTLGTDCSAVSSVDAESPQQAAELAELPGGLCHQCSDYWEMSGDVTYTIVELDGREKMNTGADNERISRVAVLERVERMLKRAKTLEAARAAVAKMRAAER